MKRKAALAAMGTVLLLGLWVGLAGHGAEDLAELHVTKIFLEPPSTIVRGETVEIHFRLANTGTRSADDFIIGFFIRPQGSASWDLLEQMGDIDRPPSQQDFLEETFTLATLDLELGTYEVRIMADLANEIQEVDELNNELVTTMTIVDSSLGLPDLQPETITYSRTNPSSNDDSLPWIVTTRVRNAGEAQAGAFSVVFLVDGVEFDRKFEFVLPAGSSKDYAGELDPFTLGLTSGTHSIEVIVDPGEQVVEQDEDNNSIDGALTLLSPELSPLSVTFDKSVLHFDEEIEVTSEICNKGAGAARDVEVSFYAGHIRFGTASIDLLGQGATTEVAAILDPEKDGLADAPAVYEIRVVVDPNDTLNELDEANNEMSRSVTILRPAVKLAEVHPESLELTPASPIELTPANTAVTVSSVVSNTGRSTAEDLDVAFYYRVKGARLWHEFPCSDDLSCDDINLGPGEQVRLVGVLPFDNVTLGPGIYEVRVAVDTAGAVAELDEANNELITTLTVLGSRLPDFVVSIDAIEPSLSLQKGQTARVTATVRNVGEEPASETLAIFSLCRLAEGAVQGQAAACTGDFDIVGIQQVPSLGIGGSATLQLNIETTDIAMLPGQYRLKAEINTDGIVKESDASNNAASSIFALQGPDLLPFASTFTAVPSGTIDQGVVGEVDFSVTIANIGPIAAGGFDVMLGLVKVENGVRIPVPTIACGEDPLAACDELDYFASVFVPGIGAAEQLGIACSLDLSKADLEPGQYIVQVYVDRVDANIQTLIDEGQVPEHSELNNSAELPLVIVGQPGSTPVHGGGTGAGADLNVVYANLRAKPDKVTAWGQVRNDGSARSRATTARFTITLPDNSQSTAVVNVPALDPGESINGEDGLQVELVFDPVLPLGGDVRVWFEVLISDANSLNNSKYREVDVK